MSKPWWSLPCALILCLLPAALRAEPAGKSPPSAAPAAGGTPALKSDLPLASPPPDAQEQDDVLYALGATLGKNLATFNLSKAELESVKKGFSDAVAGQKLRLNPAEYGPRVQALLKGRMEARAASEKKRSEAFLAQTAKQPGVEKLPSGVLYQSVRAGTGPSPKATDRVKVNYRGTLLDGTEFDSSYARHEPVEFPLDQVIPCWTEGVQKMKQGGKAKLVCPAATAYGDQGSPNIPPGSTLQFEVELLQVNP